MPSGLLIFFSGLLGLIILIICQIQLSFLRRRVTKAEQETEDARRLKSEFIAKVSHELKTPLNNAVGYVDLLRDKKYGEITNEQSDILRRVRDACDRLLALIQDLLNFSGADLGKIEVHLTEFDLNGELRTALELVEQSAKSKSVAIHSSFDSSVGVIISDRQKLYQAVVNVLGNSVKFTENGRIDLRTEFLGQKNMALIEIKDTGIGIPQEELPHVFEEFRQADGSIKRDYGGQGLGLSIAQKFIHFLGGEIGIQSEKGAGTIVRIVIPKSISHPMRREEERAPARQALEHLK